MNLFFCALVLACMLLFDEIEASTRLRINTKGKRRGQAESTTSGHLYTSRATMNLPTNDNEETLGQRALDLHGHERNTEEVGENFQHIIAGPLNVAPPSKKQKKMQAFFCEHHGISPHFLKKELAALRAERLASTLPMGNLNLGDTGTSNFVAPPALPHPQAHNAGIPFNPNFAHPSAGYGTQGYVQPPVHQLPWGTGTDFGAAGTNYGGAGMGYGGAGTNYGGTGWADGGTGAGYGGTGWGEGGTGAGYGGTGWGEGGTGSGYEGTGWGGGGTGQHNWGSGWGDGGSGAGNGK